MWWLRIIALNGVARVIDFLHAVEGACFVIAMYDKGFPSLIYVDIPQSHIGSASD